jgi:hypothetical protein
MNVIKIRKNDIVRNVNPIKLNYSDRVIPVNTEFTVWKASRDGRLACYAIDRTYGYGSIYLKDSDVVKIEKPLPKVNVGDVFAADWGYEQTQTDWFRVVEVKAASAKLVRLRESREYTGPMCGYATVDVNSNVGEPKLYRIQRTSDGTACFKIASYACAFPADPKVARFFSEWH